MRTLPDFSNAHILVAGDLMLDKYWHGDTQRISPEAPVPVVKVVSEEIRAGGAANVALNIAKLGASCTCLGITGEDAAAQSLKDLLCADDVKVAFVRSQLPTTTKLRVISQQQQLIRTDFEDTKVPTTIVDQVESRFQQALPKAKVVILSDYSKGCLSRPQSLIQHCKNANIPVLIDPKGADFRRYKGATLLTPNLKEFESVAGTISNNQDLEDKALKLIKLLGLRALLITRGADGMSLIQAQKPALHIPAYAQEVYDVTGAGDTVIATLAIAIGSGETLEAGVKLANLAASIVVSKLGTAFTSRRELQQKLMQHKRFGVVSAQELTAFVLDAKERGETIVMTNGCFDMLHAGHIMYLQEARQKGHRLIVAVNSDESVRELKGPTRPIHPLDQRMELLAALRDVDWVVPFFDETPQKLISQVLPDILVKGGDYEVEQIAGHKEVLAAGGSVHVLGFREGISTSKTIERIKETH